MTNDGYRGFKLWKFRFSCFDGCLFAVDYITKYDAWYSFDFLVSKAGRVWGFDKMFYDGKYYLFGLGPVFKIVVGPLW